MLNMRRSVKGLRLLRRCECIDQRSRSLTPSVPSAQSTLTNKSRLKLLHRREEHLQDLFSTSRSSILALAGDDGRYTQFLEGIIIQGFLQLMESNVTVLARKKDSEIAKQATEGAAKQYHEISGREVDYEIEATLSDDGCVTLLLYLHTFH